MEGEFKDNVSKPKSIEILKNELINLIKYDTNKDFSFMNDVTLTLVKLFYISLEKNNFIVDQYLLPKFEKIYNETKNCNEYVKSDNYNDYVFVDLLNLIFKFNEIQNKMQNKIPNGMLYIIPTETLRKSELHEKYYCLSFVIDGIKRMFNLHFKNKKLCEYMENFLQDVQEATRFIDNKLYKIDKSFGNVLNVSIYPLDICYDAIINLENQNIDPEENLKRKLEENEIEVFTFYYNILMAQGIFYLNCRYHDMLFEYSKYYFICKYLEIISKYIKNIIIKQIDYNTVILNNAIGIILSPSTQIDEEKKKCCESNKNYLIKMENLWAHFNYSITLDNRMEMLKNNLVVNEILGIGTATSWWGNNNNNKDNGRLYKLQYSLKKCVQQQIIIFVLHMYHDKMTHIVAKFIINKDKYSL
jgi:hypothetical protein